MTPAAENDFPPQLQNLVDGFNDHHNPLFWLRLVPAIIFGGYIIQRYVSGIVNRPHFTKEDIVYQEYSASGGSNKNILTKMGGASNCLRLVVTKELLWVTSWFPFSLIAGAYDLEHVIPLRAIQSIEGKKTLGAQRLILTYADDAGKTHSLRLVPRNTQAFLDALETSAARTGTMIPVTNVVPEEPIPTLGVALREYWPHLLAVGMFPSVAFVGGEIFHLPFVVFVPVFFATMIYGFWPALTKKAPYTYQFVMGAIWLGGGLMGSVMTAIVSTILGKHHP